MTPKVLENYVGGKWTPAERAETLEVTDPASGAVLVHVPLSTAADLDAAVNAAGASRFGNGVED